jgi:hypothetical protein
MTTTENLRDQLDVTREAYDTLVENWSALKRAVRHADLPADFSSLYDRLDAYVPDSLGDVGSGQDFGQWLDEVALAIEQAEDGDDLPEYHKTSPTWSPGAVADGLGGWVTPVIGPGETAADWMEDFG